MNIKLCKAAFAGFAVVAKQVAAGLIHSFYHHIKGNLSAVGEKVCKAKCAYGAKAGPIVCELEGPSPVLKIMRMDFIKPLLFFVAFKHNICNNILNLTWEEIKMEKTFLLFVTYKAKEGMRESFVNELEENGTAAAVRAEDGCIRYDYYYSAKEPDTLFLFEEWESEEKQQIHLSAPHIKNIKAAKEKYIKSSQMRPVR